MNTLCYIFAVLVYSAVINEIQRTVWCCDSIGQRSSGSSLHENDCICLEPSEFIVVSWLRWFFVLFLAMQICRSYRFKQFSFQSESFGSRGIK